MTIKVRTVVKLPPVARRLIEKNRQGRTSGEGCGDFRGRLDKTVAYLRWKAACGILSGAIDYVASELERERLYALYRKLFPKEWKKSSAGFGQSEYNECHTEREMEFIELVSSRYFPFSSWLDWSDHRFDLIPIESVNFDFCCGDFDWRDFRPCLQFGIAAFLYRGGGLYETDWTEILSSFDLAPETLPPISRENPPYALLDRQRSNPKVERFIHLIEFIHHETGNAFIDTTCCSPVEMYTWTEENLEKLKAEYEAAQSFFNSLDSLDEDIGRHPLKIFKELISLWNTGELPARGRKKEAADKNGDDLGLLINILAEPEENAPRAGH
jgi:hypothetical protein